MSDTPSFPKSMSPGESVYAKGNLRCGLLYEVVGLPAHHYVLLIEGVRVWHLAGHVSVSDAKIVADQWSYDRPMVLRKLTEVLSGNIGLAYMNRQEAQTNLDYLEGLQNTLNVLKRS